MSTHAVVAATIARESSCLHTLEHVTCTIMIMRLAIPVTHVSHVCRDGTDDACYVSLDKPWVHVHGGRRVQMPARIETDNGNSDPDRARACNTRM